MQLECYLTKMGTHSPTNDNGTHSTATQSCHMAVNTLTKKKAVPLGTWRPCGGGFTFPCVADGDEKTYVCMATFGPTNKPRSPKMNLDS